MDHRKRILNDLLDKYEKSTQTEFKRRIMIDCTRSNYLDITDPEQKKQFLNAVTELSEKELIFYDWERKGYVVKTSGSILIRQTKRMRLSEEKALILLPMSLLHCLVSILNE